MSKPLTYKCQRPECRYEASGSPEFVAHAATLHIEPHWFRAEVCQ